MRSLRIVSISMLICFAKVTTPLPTISFNIPPFLVRPPYAMIFHGIHIATTCLVSYLLFMTYLELKQLKNTVAQKSKITKSYVTQSQFQDRFETEINDAIGQKAEIHAKQAGRHFTPFGEGESIKEQLQECYRDLVALEKRVKVLEQKINNEKTT